MSDEANAPRLRKYEVRFYEVWSRTYFVEAENVDEAYAKADEARYVGSEEDLFEYSHTRDEHDVVLMEGEAL